jgi:ABC transporter, phosphonate, periplasmic substrate-binding protein
MRTMPIGRMRISMTALSATLALLVVVMLVWIGRAPGDLSGPDRSAGFDTKDGAGDRVFRLGLIPERDIFAQRRRYRALADYLSGVLGLHVELVTSNTYHGVLNDMARGRIDGAFMGSMVATLTLDQLNARVLVKPQTEQGVTTYRGVIFVRDDSPIQSVDDLAGVSIAVVMFGFDLSASPLGFVAIMAGGFIGFAAVGTLFAAAVSSTRLQGGLLAMVVFPVSLPLVIASTQMMMRLFGDGEPLSLTGLSVLIAFDSVYLVVSWLVFELILEP